MRLRYESDSESLEIGADGATYEAWRCQTALGLRDEIGIYSAAATDEKLAELTQLALAAGILHVPEIIGIALSGQNIRTLDIEIAPAPLRRITLRQLSGLPEPLRLFEAALWQFGEALRKSPIGRIQGDTYCAPKISANAPIEFTAEIRKRCAAKLDFHPESAALVVSDQARTLFRAQVPGEFSGDENWEFRPADPTTLPAMLLRARSAVKIAAEIRGTLRWEQGMQRQFQLLCGEALVNVTD